MYGFFGSLRNPRKQRLTISIPFPSSLLPATKLPSQLNPTIRTPPCIPLNVLLHTHSCVSHRLINASLPPTARYRPVGLSASDKQAEVCACSECNVCSAGGDEELLDPVAGGHAAILTDPSPVVRRRRLGAASVGACGKRSWFVCMFCFSGAPATGSPSSGTAMAINASSYPPTHRSAYPAPRYLEPWGYKEILPPLPSAPPPPCFHPRSNTHSGLRHPPAQPPCSSCSLHPRSDMFRRSSPKRVQTL